MPFCFPYLVLISGVVLFWTSSILPPSALVFFLSYHEVKIILFPCSKSVYLNSSECVSVRRSRSLAIKLSGWCISKVLWFLCNICLQVFRGWLQRWFGMAVLWPASSTCRSSRNPFTIRILRQTGPTLSKTGRCWEKAAHIEWSCTLFGFDISEFYVHCGL